MRYIYTYIFLWFIIIYLMLLYVVLITGYANVCLIHGLLTSVTVFNLLGMC